MAGKSPEDISRRVFLEFAAASTAAHALFPTQAPIVPAYAQEVDDALHPTFDKAIQTLRLAFEPKEKDIDKESIVTRLKNWTLPDGTSASAIIPAVHQAIDALTIPTVAPYMPFPTSPMEAKYIKNYAAMGNLAIQSDLEPQAQSMQVLSPNNPRGTKYEAPNSLTATMEIDTQFQGTNAELALITKEASQLLDLPEAARVFRPIFESHGLQFNLNNPTNLPFTEDYLNVWAMINTVGGQKEIGTTPLFLRFLDTAAHMRAGGIAYENWRLNYPQEQVLVPQRFQTIGNQVVGILKKEDLLEQRGNTAVWKHGTPPEIGSPTMMRLFTAYTGIHL